MNGTPPSRTFIDQSHESPSHPGMLDSDIRPLLKSRITTTLTDAVIFDEFPVCRRGRADLAAVNGSLWGYEIKSDSDSLARLPMQVGHYDRIFDRSVACVARRHLSDVRRLVPKHWGVIEVTDDLELKDRRSSKVNRNVCRESQMRLLWRTEILKVLRSCGVAIPSDSLVSEVWNVARTVDSGQLRTAILTCLKGRGDFGSASIQMSCGDSATTEPS